MKGRREASGTRDWQEQRQRVDRLDLRDMESGCDRMLEV